MKLNPLLPITKYDILNNVHFYNCFKGNVMFLNKISLFYVECLFHVELNTITLNTMVVYRNHARLYYPPLHGIVAATNLIPECQFHKIISAPPHTLQFGIKKAVANILPLRVKKSFE